MRFEFEKLGLLDEAAIDIKDLTVICGENNTGKTYATYAIYGFLKSWRQLLRLVLADEIEKSIKAEGKYQFDLDHMFSGKVDEYLKRLGKSYAEILHRVFATDTDFFEEAVILPVSGEAGEFLQNPYQQRVQAGPDGKVLATIGKEVGTSILEVLVADTGLLQNPFGGLTDFIADAIADIVFVPHLPMVHISSAERTGAAIFRKELDMARTRMLKALNEIDSKELKRNPFQILQKIDADYAWPVEDNVDFVRQLEDIDKRASELGKEYPEVLSAFDTIIGGSYKVIKNQLVF